MAWLNGNVNHERLKYRAGVYIIKPGSLVLEDVKKEVGELLELARNNAEKDKGFEIRGTVALDQANSILAPCRRIPAQSASEPMA